MNNSIVKQLKDANFCSKHSSETPEYPDKDGYVPPNLLELIEACGIEINLSGFKNSWDCNFGFKGNTPTEAVAKLWLQLNKKINNK